MTSFRIRVLTFVVLIFAAVPALAQEAPAVNPQASLGCVFAGAVAMVVVGLLARARESQDEQAPTVPPTTTSEA